MKSRSVENGTAVGSKSLCVTCAHAHIRRGFAASAEVTYCTYERWTRPEIVPYAINECSAYCAKSQTSLVHMEKIAWILLTKNAGRGVGFVTVKGFKEIEGKDGEVIPS